MIDRGSYIDYLNNSEYYMNLGKAIRESDKVISLIDDLLATLKKASGEIIDSMIEDLNNLNDEINKMKDMAKETRECLMANARAFDGVLETWKGKKGEIFKSEILYLDDKGFTHTLIETIEDVLVNGAKGYIALKLKAYERITDTSQQIVHDIPMSGDGRYEEIEFQNDSNSTMNVLESLPSSLHTSWPSGI